jgi:hypothetical protein
VKAAFLCLAHALVIVTARVNNDPNYKYRIGYGLKQPVQVLLNTTGVDLSNGEYFGVLELFQQYLSDYKIIV